jgi:hypothetical protein
MRDHPPETFASQLALRAVLSGDRNKCKYPIVIGIFEDWNHVSRYLDYDDEPPEPYIVDAIKPTRPQLDLLKTAKAPMFHKYWLETPQNSDGDILPIVYNVGGINGTYGVLLFDINNLVKMAVQKEKYFKSIDDSINSGIIRRQRNENIIIRILLGLFLSIAAMMLYICSAL